MQFPAASLEPKQSTIVCTCRVRALAVVLSVTENYLFAIIHSCDIKDECIKPQITV